MSAASPIGRPLDRVDGHAKLTGAAAYAAEFHPEGLCYAAIVESTVPRGHIVAIDAGAARAMPGVLRVLTHENAPRLPHHGRGAVEPPAGREKSLLQDAAVRYNGEPVALVVAETQEQALDAAATVRVTVHCEEATLRFADARAKAYPAGKSGRSPPHDGWGDVKAALAEAEARVEAVYTTPMQHHNPIEPHATVAEWHDGRLTLHDSTQYVSGVQEAVAKTFGMPRDHVRVVSRFVGGGFGSKGSVWSHVVLCAMAAREVGRPVKLALTRRQLFGPVGGRPCTEQRVMLAARSDGRLLALEHHVLSHTSRFEDYVEHASAPSRSLYACPNGVTSQRLVALDMPTPTFQRAPGEATGTFAIESAMDELAYALGIDPLELRLRNYAEVEPCSGKPWSSKKLRECYAQAARRFGWDARPREPGGLRDGRWRVGWGVATATYPAHVEEAKASATLLPDGIVVVRCGTHDIGTGTYTVMAQVAADALGLAVERVRFELGDSALPAAPISGGSMTVASVAPAVQAACRALRAKLERMAGGDPRAVFATRTEPVEAFGEARPRTPEGRQGPATRSFGAVFAEARVDEDLGIVRIPRVVAAYSVGRVMNAKTASSQLRGGIVWGLGMALMEESLPDLAHGRFVNANLADYHVPTHADVGMIDVTFVEEDDAGFNALGARGIGEIGITGVAGAVANAIFHATGKRVRDLPITLDKLL